MLIVDGHAIPLVNISVNTDLDPDLIAPFISNNDIPITLLYALPYNTCSVVFGPYKSIHISDNPVLSYVIQWF